MAHVRRRMLKEIEDIKNDTYISPFFSLACAQDNLYIWSANIHCLPDFRHEGKNYTLEILCPPDYPFKPPIVKFLDPVDCICVSNATGLLRLDILNKEWSPGLTLTSIMHSIISVLMDNEPQRHSPRFT